jgi:hypothetical protein
MPYHNPSGTTSLKTNRAWAIKESLRRVWNYLCRPTR